MRRLRRWIRLGNRRYCFDWKIVGSSVFWEFSGLVDGTVAGEDEQFFALNEKDRFVFFFFFFYGFT